MGRGNGSRRLNRTCPPYFTPGAHGLSVEARKAAGTISSGITNKPMFLVFDYTTSTNSGNNGTMKVEWVKVWQNNTTGE
jgi:hypothetical protein